MFQLSRQKTLDLKHQDWKNVKNDNRLGTHSRVISYIHFTNAKMAKKSLSYIPML